MIFNTLKMENIRSYENEKIDFPSGTSLFEGDVGSGKSTILMAMEFALFGLGNQKGDALLRKGTKKGSVFLSFSLEGSEYQIKRTLFRNNKDSITQDKASLNAGGRKMLLSPSEIKERILDILNFKEPSNPRAQSVIYRYAVYTPQEEMKFILAQKPDKRLETLRKAFGIEDYKTAAENATLISRAIKEKISYLSGQISDMDVLSDKLKKKNYELTENNDNLSKFTKKRDELESSLKQQNEELDKLKQKESDLKQIEAQIPHLVGQLKGKIKLSNDYNKEIKDLEDENQNRFVPKIETLNKLKRPTNITTEQLTEKIEEIKKAVKNRGELKAELKVYIKNKQDIKDKLQDWKNKDPEELTKKIEALTKKLEDLEKNLSKHQKELQDITNRISQLEALKQDINNKLENIDGLGDVCPICGSVLDEEHKKELKQEREKEIRRFNSEIAVLNTSVKSKYEEQIEQDEDNIKQLNEDLKLYNSLIENFADLNRVEEEISEIEGKISIIEENLMLNIQEDVKFENFEEYLKTLENLLNRLREYNQAQEKLDEIKIQFKKNLDKAEEYQANIEIITREIENLNGNINNFHNQIQDLPELIGKVGKLQRIYDQTRVKLDEENVMVVEAQTLIKTLTQDVGKLTDELKEKETLKNQLDDLKNYYSWLTDYLIPTLAMIEKHVMANIHLEFDDNFQKWFNLLIDDTSKTGRIDEEFTPIIEQDGYGQEINYLSGGEKTSIALAYRLALNNIVQKVSTGMKSNLLIMDEPTDGFSKEQLFKIRDILNELNYPQIIIVSHERELESFADNIFQIEKTDGVSEVVKIS